MRFKIEHEHRPNIDSYRILDGDRIVAREVPKDLIFVFALAPEKDALFSAKIKHGNWAADQPEGWNIILDLQDKLFEAFREFRKQCQS